MDTGRTGHLKRGALKGTNPVNTGVLDSHPGCEDTNSFGVGSFLLHPEMTRMGCQDTLTLVNLGFDEVQSPH